MRTTMLLAVIGVVSASALVAQLPAKSDESVRLATARSNHVTRLVQKTRDGTPPERPPEGVLDLIHFKAPSGMLAAYVSPRPASGAKKPAIIWITGGDSNSIGNVWSKRPASNDQTASAFRKAGIVTMYPSLRGGNDNPGYREGFYGEVDDILAAYDYLKSLDYVDSTRIYLGGHSTGATLALLTAESTDRFRSVFAFGPVEDVRDYGGDFMYADPQDKMEVLLRSPTYWLPMIQAPVFVFEGSVQGNGVSIDAMQPKAPAQWVKMFKVPGKTHFSVLAPITALIADKILADTEGKPVMTIVQSELDSAAP